MARAPSSTSSLSPAPSSSPSGTPPASFAQSKADPSFQANASDGSSSSISLSNLSGSPSISGSPELTSRAVVEPKEHTFHHRGSIESTGSGGADASSTGVEALCELSSLSGSGSATSTSAPLPVPHPTDGSPVPNGLSPPANGATGKATRKSPTKRASPNNPSKNSQTGQTDANGQPLGSNGKPLRHRQACDACHLRRVKCQYRQPGDPTCIKCEKKGIRCTTSYIKPYKARTGKRIEQARNVYGVLDGESDGFMHNQEHGSSECITPGFERRNSGFGSGSRFDQEIAASLAAELLEVSFEIMPYPISNVIWPNVLDSYREANRRGETLDDELNVVCACLIAMGARASNHIAVLSVQTPPFRDQWVKSIQGVVDLSRFGKQRQSFVESLVARAVHLADQAGLMRRASLKSIVALLMLENLVNLTDSTFKTGFPFITAACDHLRALLGSEETSWEEKTALVHHVAPFLFNRDAQAAAASDRFVNLTTLDLRAFFSESPIGIAAFLGTEGVPQQDTRSLETRTVALNIRIAALGRAFVEAFVSPLARKMVCITPDLVERLWTQIDMMRNEIYTLRSSAPTTNQPNYYVPMATSLSRLIFQCHRQIELRLAKNMGSDGRHSPSSTDSATQSELHDLSQVWSASAEKVETEMQNITEMLQAVVEDTCDMKAPLLISLRYLLSALQQLPDGADRFGRALFHHKKPKRTAAIQALRSLGYAFSDATDFADRMAFALNLVEESEGSNGSSKRRSTPPTSGYHPSSALHPSISLSATPAHYSPNPTGASSHGHTPPDTSDMNYDNRHISGALGDWPHLRDWRMASLPGDVNSSPPQSDPPSRSFSVGYLGPGGAAAAGEGVPTGYQWLPNFSATA